MNWLIIFIAFLLSFILSLLGMPLVLAIANKLKVGQPILKYVDQHKGKSGTPTMGGLGFILPSTLVAIVLSKGISVGRIASITVICYCFLGFLDDFLKVKRKNNVGLSPLQKIIGQVGIALLLSYYCYKNYASRMVFLPFTTIRADFDIWIIPFAIFVFLAVTNAVNLTDGLDGLATNTSVVYLLFFFIIVGIDVYFGKCDSSLLVFCISVIGGCLAFSIFNSNPARIFMGDTGSLALGGAVASVGCFSGNYLIIPIIGIMFVVSCISVIIQVIVFKINGKRVFKMAPFHHHLEKSGQSEQRIVAIYGAITAIFGALGVLSKLYPL